MKNNVSEQNLNLEDHFKIVKILEGRNKIILHNNTCIIEIIAFYENVLLNDIIRPFLFNENYDKNLEIKNIIIDRLSFMDRFKIICKIAKIYGVQNFKEFDNYIKMRNKIAHNISSVVTINIKTKESKIYFAGEEITWSKYIGEIKKWAKLSYSMSEFILNIFKKVKETKEHAIFPYCEIEGNCVLVQHNLIYPEIDGEYISFFKNGFNMDLLDYVNEEQKYIKESDLNG